MDIEIKIALIGLFLTSAFAITGLFLNFFEMKRNNRIAVSARLSEASKILSEELVATGVIRQIALKKLRDIKEEPESNGREDRILKISNILEYQELRQKTIDENQKKILELFKNLEGISFSEADKVIAISYSHQAHAKSQLDLVDRLNNK